MMQGVVGDIMEGVEEDNEETGQECLEWKEEMTSMKGEEARHGMRGGKA